MTKDSSSPAAPSLFKQPKPLDSQAHRSLRLQARQPYHFAAQQSLVPVMASEMAQVAREYAVVFSHAPGSLPLALLGARQGHNAYVRPSGHWAARYVPAHVRRYPFVLAESAPANAAQGANGTNGTNGAGAADTAGTRLVMVDADAPHLVSEGGLPLFESDGKPSQVLQQVQNVLVMLERDSLRTLQLMAEIEAAGLLIERMIPLQPRTGAPLGLNGLRVVDEERLAALDPATLHALQKSGALRLVYAHLMSIANLLDGPLVEGLAAEADAKAANGGGSATGGSSGSSGSISFEGIDWSKF